jgi:cellulose synthase/poly-beta-1,6-N-acetylglucosamine synthase-like glycosyltransferase
MEFGLVATVFWVSLAAVLYAYVLYPLLIGVLAALFARREEAPPLSDDECPRVSILIAAYNEEAEIDGQIQRLLAVDYPKDRLQIVIASDGSQDLTPFIVERYADQGVQLLHYKVRRGKATVLNSSFASLTGDIVVLSDANTHIDAGAVRKLVRWFRDPRVGVVCGRLDLVDPATGRNVDGLYWKYETYLKKREGRLGGLLGANGGIYALRRCLHVPIPNNTIIDDFVMPLLVRLRHGCAIVYDPTAVAVEETPAGITSEFHRRARIGAGGFQSIPLLWRLLNPRQGWTAFTFFSHKMMRWLCPFFLLALLISSAALVWDPFYRGALVAQGCFYLASLIAAFLPARLRVLRPLRLTTMFTGMNAALLVGFWRWVSGRQQAAWVRTARVAETGGGAVG